MKKLKRRMSTATHKSIILSPSMIGRWLNVREYTDIFSDQKEMVKEINRNQGIEI